MHHQRSVYLRFVIGYNNKGNTNNKSFKTNNIDWNNNKRRKKYVFVC